MAQNISNMGEGEGVNEYLKKLADDIKKNTPTDTNGGHNALMEDLSKLLREAYVYEFHDFKNEKYSTPKVELINKLNDLATNVKEGKYDN